MAAALRALPTFSAATMLLSEQSLRHNTLITDGIINTSSHVIELRGVTPPCIAQVGPHQRRPCGSAPEPLAYSISKHSDPASSPRHRQHIVHLSIRTPLRGQDTGNKSCILAFTPRFEPKTPATNRTSWHSHPASSQRHRQQIVHLSSFEPQTPAKNRKS